MTLRSVRNAYYHQAKIQKIMEPLEQGLPHGAMMAALLMVVMVQLWIQYPACCSSRRPLVKCMTAFKLFFPCQASSSHCFLHHIWYSAALPSGKNQLPFSKSVRPECKGSVSNGGLAHYLAWPITWSGPLPWKFLPATALVWPWSPTAPNGRWSSLFWGEQSVLLYADTFQWSSRGKDKPQTVLMITHQQGLT